MRVRSASEELVHHVREDVVGKAVPFTGDAALEGAGHCLGNGLDMVVRSSLLDSLFTTSVGTVTDARSRNVVASLMMLS